MARDLFEEYGIVPTESDAGRDLFKEAGIDVEPVDKRTFGNRLADVGRSAAGAAVSAVGTVPLAVGRLVREGAEELFGLTMDEARRLAESEGTPEKALEWYERSNRLNPGSLAGRSLEAGGRRIMEAGDSIRDARSLQAREAARQSMPTGDLDKPGTWSLGENPSFEGAAHVLSDVAGSMAPPIAAAVATRGRSAATQMRAGGAVVGAQIGGAAMDEAQQYLRSMDDATLTKASPVFRELVASGMSLEDARAVLVRRAENAAATMAAPVGMAGGKATAAILGKPGEALASKLPGVTGKALLLGVLGATEEGLQEVGEGVATRTGINMAAGIDRDVMEGTFAESLLGAKGGGTVGAGRGIMAGLRKQNAGTQEVEDLAPANPSGNPPIGRDSDPVTVPDEESPVLPLPMAQQPERKRTNDAARLAELDLLKQARGLTEGERAESQTLLQRLDTSEKALLDAPDRVPDDPKRSDFLWRIKGAPTQFSTEAGVKLDAEYALVDADSLVTSHDENLRQNPLFPAELQPRDRSRHASEMQVSGIVQKLDPARLGVSADSATGAPIIGADGLVESGNARTIALKRVYQANGMKAENYKAWLRESAAQFGIDPAAVDGMDKPVLVRVRNTPVNRAEFARQANQSTIQRMSPSEQAAADAKRLTSLEGLNPDDNGEFSTSYDFIRQFMAGLPITEQSDMIESDGRLSTTGYRRIQNAVLAKAYGDSPTLRRMTESLDNRLVNVSKALTRAAPTIAAARERIQVGALHDADIAPDLVQAVELLSALKEKGWTVEQELAQIDLTGPKYSPEASELLRFLADNVRSPRRIAEFLQRYYEALEAAGDPNQGSLLGDNEAPARADLLKTARGTPDGQQDQGAGDPAGQDRQEPQDAQGRGRSAQGDEAAQIAAVAGQPGAAGGEAEGVGTARLRAPDQRRVDQKSPARTADRDFWSYAKEQGHAPKEVSVGSELHTRLKLEFEALKAGKARFKAMTGEKLSGQWVGFTKAAGSLGVPRAVMPQIKAEHRGALTQFLAAQGVTHQAEADLDSVTLRPTQTEFSTEKVKQAQEFEGGERSILISADSYVLDGHHQWLAKLAQGLPIRAIRFDAPMADLLPMVREFPSADVSTGAVRGDTAATPDLDSLRMEALAIAHAGAFAKRGITFEDRDGETVVMFKGEEIATLYGDRSRSNLVKAIAAAMYEPALSRPTAADVAAQQDRAARAANLDEQEQVRRESEAGAGLFELAREDGRQDTTGDIFNQSREEAPAPAAQGKKKPESAAMVNEDVGEQLYANRRNFTGRGIKWDDVRELNDTLKLKEVTKAKVWPRPDYEKLVAEGMPPVVARLVKQVYDGLSAGPTMAAGKAPTDADLLRYIDTLGKIREGLFSFVNDHQRVAAFAQGVLGTIKRDASAIGPVSVIDLAREAMDPQGVATVLVRQVWPEQFAEGVPTMGRFRRGSDAHQDVSVIGGNKALGALQFTRQDLSKWVADLEKGWPAKREAWQVQGYRVLGPDEYRLDKYDGARGMVHYIRPVQGRGSWGRAEPFTGGRFALVLDGGSFAQEFDTREAAVEAAREKVKRQAGVGQDIRGTNIEEAERTGPARREEGEDITSQRLMDTFGFRGVNFGREGWIKQAERQAYLNQAFDGLMDLAHVLGVPPKAMSLDGKLGIAFGAQGKGRFAAHFVPGYNEINLTRTKGAGTLAHEWGHGLDHYFALQAGLEKDAEPFLSEHASKGDKSDRMVFEDGRYVAKKDVPTFGDGIRPEIVRAFRDIYQAMNKRNESPGEAAARRQHAQESAGRRLSQWLRAARLRIEESPASNKADLLAEFDQHAEKLRDGDAGDGYEQAGKQAFSTRVAAVRNLIKDATGRVWSLDETNGLESAASYVRSLAGKQEADGTHEPQQVATQYKSDSRAMDTEKGGKAYWSTPTEMFARAFELYVHDALSQRGQRNTFLTDAQDRASKPAQIPDNSSATARASGAMRDLYLYPVGKERETLRQAFAALVGQIKTRETERGVALFNRKDEAYDPRHGTDSTPSTSDRADIEALETILDDGNRGAIDAGSARRAREVHPFRWVRLPDLHGLGNIAAAFGKRVVGFDVTTDVLSREFGFFNGVTRPGRDNRIFINAKSDRPHLAVLGHEMAHQLKRDRPELFQELVQAIRPYVKAREYGEDFARSAVARYSYPQGASAEQRNAAVREEFIGEVLSDGFMDPGFWRALGDHNPSLLQRLTTMVRSLIDAIRDATGYTARTSRYLSDFDRVMGIAGRVMAEYGLGLPSSTGQDGPAAFNRQGEPTETEAFKRWFGDSKVVDPQGKPMRVFHGTKRDFAGFASGPGVSVASGSEAASKLGFFFSSDLEYVQGLIGHETDPNGFADGGNIMPVYLALKNPKIEPMRKIQEIEDGWSAERATRYRKHLESLGHDGIIFEGRSGREFVAFQPGQIKSAIGNSGEFDPDSGDVRFLRNAQGSGQGSAWERAKAKARELTSPQAIDRLLYEFQDKLIDLRRLRDHIAAIGGTITDLNDAYLGEELYHKRLAKRTADFLDKELKPLLADMRSWAIKLPEFEQYLHARHAPEANRVLAQRNPNRAMLDTLRTQAGQEVRKLKQQLQRAQANGSATTAIEEALELAQEEQAKWLGAQAFDGTESERNALSGMTDDQAKAFMDGLSPAKLRHMQALAAQVDAMQAKTLDTLEDYGLMDPSTLSAWRSTYQHYVPLHRDEARPESDRHPIGQGFSVKGTGTKSRVGSTEKVTNILAHIAMQREAALTRGEKNNVVKKLYLMAAQNPDPGVWSLDAPPRIKTVDPRNGTVRTGIDPTYKHRPNVLMVRIAGRDQSIVFNEHNPSALRLAQSMKNLDIDDLHVVLGLVSKGTRWFASVNTQYNPIFGLINFARDVQAALLNLSTTPLAGHEKAVSAHVLTAMRAIYRQRRGKASRNGEMTALWDEFESVGGTTGYRDLFSDAEDRARALIKDLNALDRGQVSKAAHAVVDWLSHYNEVMENAVRLAAYKVALDQGMSKERAASLAKNVTVNFNRKGRQTRELGALYAFFNAALQGTARMVETLRGPIGRKIMFGGVALGALNTLLGMAMMGGGGGDDDEPDNWGTIPEFIKERSLIIPLGREDYVTIPMPLGFHVFPNIGRKAVEFAMGDGSKSTGRQIGDLLMILVDAFNPVGGAGNLGQMVAPTVIDPVVSLMQNRDWTGRPIYREDMSSLDPTPGHARTKDTASTVSRALAEAINAVTGGNEYRPGAWSPTPDQIDYVFGQLTGGLGRELIKVNQTASAAVTGDELPPYKMPLVGRLYGNTRGAAGQSELYYENIRHLNELGNELRGRHLDRKDVTEFKKEEPLTNLILLGNGTQNRIRDLRILRRRAAELQAPGYKEEVSRIDGQIAEAMARLNNEVARVRKESAQ